MNGTFSGFVGKTVERVEFVNILVDELTLHVTDGSMLTVREGVPDIPEATWHGLDIEICESMNGGEA